MKVPQTTLVYLLSGSIVIRIIRNREVLLFVKSGKHVKNLNTPLKPKIIINISDQPQPPLHFCYLAIPLRHGMRSALFLDEKIVKNEPLMFL